MQKEIGAMPEIMEGGKFYSKESLMILSLLLENNTQ